jgi:uncharacterized membrane protein YphA (DoxX/SURF4 family)
MNIALWIAQILLACMFIMGGGMKAFSPTKFRASMPWAKDASNGYLGFIGVVELLGAIGLILPGVLDIAPILTGIAAIGFAIIMIMAISLHAKRKENIAFNTVLLLIAIFIIVGRFAIEKL